MRFRFAYVLPLAASLVVTATASASILRAMPLEKLVTRADRVVLGKVEKQEAKWTDDHDAIYTEVTLRIERSYKGSDAVGSTVIVRREGGSVDGLGMKVFGAAEFTVGEEAVVFAEQRGRANFVVGMAQGKLHVLPSTSANQRARVVQDLSGMGLMGAPDLRLAGDMSLEELELELQRIKTSDKPVQK